MPRQHSSSDCCEQLLTESLTSCSATQGALEKNGCHNCFRVQSNDFLSDFSNDKKLFHARLAR